eukprot:3501352-Pleurochrysis_carterae.AAC.1
MAQHLLLWSENRKNTFDHVTHQHMEPLEVTFSYRLKFNGHTRPTTRPLPLAGRGARPGAPRHEALSLAIVCAAPSL